ncbi:hypothetical protein RJP21_18790 [Paenibacillus sp. VCA1]|uniref:hypothetical protein n=1 Tax=Paenibacillus sp. VCA1 TaxID=3039148 RepID=UPI002872454B|nr:hypothetical protein [Paenibacillus sp. VCA1]MDR9855664.1 hypothetical protein [Paenibacillus sp. VCA1]
MRKFTKACFVLSTVFLLLVPVVNAQENVDDENEQNSELIRIDSDLTIEKKFDGRVFPILNSNNQKLTSDQQDAILKEMRFTEDEIQSMSPGEKESTALAGGVKVDSQTTLVQYFNASDGKKYLITDENRDEIEALRQQEAKKLSKELNKEIQIQPLSTVKDGIFSARGHVTYQGKSPNATEFEYRYHDSFDWSSTPQNLLTDTLAHAWQSHSTSVRSQAVTNTVVLGSNNYKYPSVIPEGLYGSYFKFAYTTRFDSMNGYLYNDVRIPISEKGHTGKFVAKYAHPWTLGTPAVSIGPLSISFSSFIGDEWYWETIYTINGQPV